MRALTWQGRESVSVETVPDPVIDQPTDAIVRVTSTAICGSDLHLYAVLGMYLDAGDVLGHEAMGIVEEVGPAAGPLKAGDRVVIPFNISCGTCWMCARGLFSQCETTQVRAQGTGASLFGFTQALRAGPRRTGTVRAGAAGTVRPGRRPGRREPRRALPVPLGRAAHGLAGRRVRRRPGRRDGGGRRPRSDRADGCPIAAHRGASRVIGLDLVPERLEMARRHGIDVLDVSGLDDVTDAVHALTGRPRGGLGDRRRRHGGDGSPVAAGAQQVAGILPDGLAAAVPRRWASTGSPRCRPRSTSSDAAAPSRSSASTGERRTPSR